MKTTPLDLVEKPETSKYGYYWLLLAQWVKPAASAMRLEEPNPNKLLIHNIGGLFFLITGIVRQPKNQAKEL